jgi:hypothetical protein
VGAQIGAAIARSGEEINHQDTKDTKQLIASSGQLYSNSALVAELRWGWPLEATRHFVPWCNKLAESCFLSKVFVCCAGSKSRQ